MKITYAQTPLEKSIFLAGPTPRNNDVLSWRPDALRILEARGFNGTVFVPELENPAWKYDYDGQINWEWEALNQATAILFWIPRDLTLYNGELAMPAFTTNVEFGLSIHSSKVILGYPPGAPKMGYLKALANRYHVPIARNLGAACGLAIKKTMYPFSEFCETE